MGEAEIRRELGALIDDLLARVADLQRERDELRTEVNNLRAMACANPSCQLCGSADN